MKKRARTFALCLMLIVLGWVLVFSQVGADKRPPKTSATKTQPKRTTTRTTSSSTQSSKPRQTAPQIEMVLIPAGTLMIGSPDGVGDDNEHPQHYVTVQSFYMGKYEVTQAQYKAVMGTNPSGFKGDTLPVEGVSWNDAQKFIGKLNRMQSRYTYRLPSEAEWEYACRAGTTTAFAFGDSLSSEQANFNLKTSRRGTIMSQPIFGGGDPYLRTSQGVSRDKPITVGSLQPNAFGLYDMHGNVWEWCQDWYHENYNGAPNDGSAWVSEGKPFEVVARGGSWYYGPWFCRSAGRSNLLPDYGGIGFRLVASARN